MLATMRGQGYNGYPLGKTGILSRKNRDTFSEKQGYFGEIYVRLPMLANWRT
jgi:hypothetical protein